MSQPSPVNGEDEPRFSDEELSRLWLTRARGVLLGSYASDELVNIYGLRLQRVPGATQYCDVFYPRKSDDEEDDYLYLDTLNVNRFGSSRHFLRQLLSYFPEDAEPPEEPDETEDEPSHTPTFQ